MPDNKEVKLKPCPCPFCSVAWEHILGNMWITLHKKECYLRENNPDLLEDIASIIAWNTRPESTEPIQR